MKRRGTQDTHPFALPLIALAAIIVFGAFYWLFGIGERLFNFAIGAALLYGGTVIITFAIAGFVWGAIRLFGGGK